MSTNEFTYEYFLQEFNTFFDMLGDKNTYKEDKLDLAFKGFSYVYLHCDENPNPNGMTISETFKIAVNEMNRRLDFINISGLKYNRQIIV